MTTFRRALLAARIARGAVVFGMLVLLPVTCLAQAGANAVNAADIAPATVASTAGGDPLRDAAMQVAQRFPAQSIKSVATADAALADVKRSRVDIEARHRAAEADCRPAFFMTRCLDATQEKKRAALALLRPVEIEADAFKRRNRVVDRDRALTEKNAKAEREALVEQNAVSVRKQAESASVPHPSERSTTVSGPAAPHGVRTPHVAKPLTPSIDATTAARNMASFDRKATESAQRQREIEAKKAEKEQDRARKKTEADAKATGAAGSTPTAPK